jgi:diguanylate cyclase (GGDEF)-like protein/PAS domain S-box-containing protein
MPKDVPPRLNEIIVQALQASGDGFGVYDQDDVMIFCNKPVSKLLGYKGNEALGRTFEENLRQSYAIGAGVKADDNDLEGMIKRAKESMKKKGFSSFESDAANGEWNQVTRFKTKDGYTFMYSTDITKLKSTENSLRDALRFVKKLAETDSLTGISNRRHFIESAKVEFERSKRYGHPLSILALDIDHFKSVNDTYGHLAGDKVLEAICQSCLAVLRNSDIFGRLGGEEFSILLPEADEKGAIETARKILKSVDELNVRYEGQVITFTTSIGISKMEDNCQDLEMFMKQSDKALYQAKHNGRNRFEVWR